LRKSLEGIEEGWMKDLISPTKWSRAFSINYDMNTVNWSL
jgi:hypothetical protein